MWAWYRLRLTSCSRGLESQAHHLHFFLIVLLKLLWEKDKNKQKQAWIGPFLELTQDVLLRHPVRNEDIFWNWGDEVRIEPHDHSLLQTCEGGNERRRHFRWKIFGAKSGASEAEQNNPVFGWIDEILVFLIGGGLKKDWLGYKSEWDIQSIQINKKLPM